ncbi:MAG: carbohydrate ABC transporter permease [Caldilineaceae bacterium]|jgi:arabinogalactan oligomer/maltooligosaccharide transport system permease protein
MIGWSGRRKAFTVLLFVGPTLLGILLLNVFPILLSTYVSFTNRNKFHPNPDCSVVLTSVLDPVCWPMFQGRAGRGLAEPYSLQTPLFQNYIDLVGKLFTVEAVQALLLILICFLPLMIAALLNRYWERKITRPVSASTLWLFGLGGGLLLAFALNANAAYQQLLTTGDFFVVVWRTILFVVARVPLSFGLGLVLALILNSSHLPGRTFFRVILFLPWATSSLAILMALVWQFFFREQGVINQVLRIIGFDGYAWLSDPVTAFAAIVITDVWFSYPFFMVVILGALQSVPNDVYEAADVEGASWWTQLTRITLPLIRPAILPATVLTSITAFQMFGTAWAITQGGPTRGAGVPGATEFVIVYAYKQIYQSQNYGSASAFAVILFLFLFAATLYSLRYTRITKGAYE